jgi:Zn-finger nucleic acid-binding protein
MAKCSSCSAPLAANTNKCLYCGTRNDVDLKDKHHYAIINKGTSLICPQCSIPLQTIDLKLDGSFLIERCATCFGLFFGTGKIEVLLEKSVNPVFDVNLQQLDQINQDRFPTENEIKYVKCPVCQSFMNRNAFGYRSGVVVDRCKIHGIWLDSGEITHLLEWKKAGGQILDSRQNEIEAQAEAKRRPIIKNTSKGDSYYPDVAVENDLLTTVVSLIEQLFQ